MWRINNANIEKMGQCWLKTYKDSSPKIQSHVEPNINPYIRAFGVLPGPDLVSASTFPLPYYSSLPQPCFCFSYILRLFPLAAVASAPVLECWHLQTVTWLTPAYSLGHSGLSSGRLSVLMALPNPSSHSLFSPRYLLKYLLLLHLLLFFPIRL